MDNEQTVSKLPFNPCCASAISSGQHPISLLSRKGLALSELRLQLRFSSLIPPLLAQPVEKLLVGIFRQVAVIPALSATGASVYC